MQHDTGQYTEQERDCRFARFHMRFAVRFLHQDQSEMSGRCLQPNRGTRMSAVADIFPILQKLATGSRMIETHLRPARVRFGTTKYLRSRAELAHLNPVHYSGSYSYFLPHGPSLVAEIRRLRDNKLKESRVLRITPIPPRVDNLLLVDIEYSCTSCDGFGVVRTTAVEWMLARERPRANFDCRKCRTPVI
jgi:hypothetical protein